MNVCVWIAICFHCLFIHCCTLVCICVFVWTCILASAHVYTAIIQHALWFVNSVCVYQLHVVQQQFVVQLPVYAHVCTFGWVLWDPNLGLGYSRLYRGSNFNQTPLMYTCCVQCHIYFSHVPWIEHVQVYVDWVSYPIISHRLVVPSMGVIRYQARIGLSIFDSQLFLFGSAHVCPWVGESVILLSLLLCGNGIKICWDPYLYNGTAYYGEPDRSSVTISLSLSLSLLTLKNVQLSLQQHQRMGGKFSKEFGWLIGVLPN